MDFNTGGSGGRPDDQSRPLYGGEAGGSPSGPQRGSGEGMGQEFNLSDPVGSFISTLRNVLLSPVNFFRGIARRGDFINPAVFALIVALITALIGGIVGLVVSPLLAGPGDTGEALVGGIVGFVFSLILTPILVAIVLLIAAGISHLFVMLFLKPSNAGFEATFRVICYSYAPSIFNVLAPIPLLGQLIALAAAVYSVVLAIFGIRELHNTTTGRAAAIVLIPVAVILLLVLVLGAMIGAALFFGAQQQEF